MIGQDVDENDIGNEGCSHLSKASWPKLEEIDLSK